MHLFLGLPLMLLPIGFHSNILLGVLFSSIRITWTSQAILLLFINLTMSAFFFFLLIHSSRNSTISNFIKIRSAGAEFFHDNSPKKTLHS
jgi:hypothetical protein